MPRGSHESAKTHCPQGHGYADHGFLNKRPDGRFHRACRVCKNAQAKERNKLEHVKQSNRARNYRVKFGITIEEYNSLLSVVPGCAICGKTPEQNGRNLEVDHDHDTGRVRGLLCIDCNTGLGKLQDGKLFSKALEYLGG